MKRILLQPAYVLHRRAYRENSFLVDLFTREYGCLTVIAKGVRDKRSALQGLLQPFNPLLISFAGKGELMSLSHAEAAGSVAYLQGDCLFAGFYLNELLMCLLQKWDPHTALYLSYEATLRAFHAAPPLMTTQPSGCEAGLDDHLQEKAQHTQKYVSIFPANDRSKMPADGRLRTKPEHLQKILRSFEKYLLDELGYGIFPRSDVSLHAMFIPDNYYRFVPEQGFVTSELEHHENQSGNVFSGRSLLAFAKEDWQDEASLADARRLIRFILAPLLGARPVHSRRLFIK